MWSTFAAGSHVDCSICDLEIFLKTNVLGTQCLLECAKVKWQRGRDETEYPVYRPGVKYETACSPCQNI
jgi:dTDP-glucose 4,6-dehydratase